MLKTFVHADIAGVIEVWRVIAFLVLVLVSLAAGRLVRFFLTRASGKVSASKMWLAVLLKALAKSMPLVVIVLGFRIAIPVLVLLPLLGSIAGTVVRVLNATAIGLVLYGLVDVVDYYLVSVAQKTESKVDDVLAPLVGKSVRITIAIVVVLNVVVVVSGKDMTTILASLGVGGLAIALAGQDTIRNFFGSLVIFGDKPFEIGDRIVVDGHDGPVEDVGFRSTRLRTLDGHVVTVPNSEMVNKTVRNIGKRPYIRRVSNITITYDTPPEKVERAVGIIKEILKDHEGMNPDFPPRVYFNDFNEWALNILMIYWYHPPDYWSYMDFTERVNSLILQRFNKEGIEFAFPSQTVYLEPNTGE
jgi:MscS family membrane protein